MQKLSRTIKDLKNQIEYMEEEALRNRKLAETEERTWASGYLHGWARAYEVIIDDLREILQGLE